MCERKVFLDLCRYLSMLIESYIHYSDIYGPWLEPLNKLHKNIFIK